MKRRLKVTVNGEEFDVIVEESGEEVATTPRPAAPARTESTQRPRPRAVPQPDPEPEPEPEVTTGGRGDTEITAPLSGTIKSVKVKVGAKVTSGETVLTLEALKLENEIISPVNGTIASVEVSDGQNVENGQLLVTINSA